MRLITCKLSEFTEHATWAPLVSCLGLAIHCSLAAQTLQIVLANPVPRQVSAKQRVSTGSLGEASVAIRGAAHGLDYRNNTQIILNLNTNYGFNKEPATPT